MHRITCLDINSENKTVFDGQSIFQHNIKGKPHLNFGILSYLISDFDYKLKPPMLIVS